MKKVAIIGHFGGNEQFYDGQTIKTKTLYEELQEYSGWDIQRIDTYWKNKRPDKLFISLIKALILRKDIIVLLSKNGMRFFFPLLSFFANYFHLKIYHDVIGGNLDKYVVAYPSFKKYLNSFSKNWVETNTLRNKLLEKGVTNCEVVPNFKRLNIVDITEIPCSFIEPYRFCTFSRVMPEKGIESAIIAIEDINNKFGRQICSLDIYGVVDDDYSEAFEALINHCSASIQYCGVVSYKHSVDILKNYYALLFPTYWDGEGFPGTIIDAFSAGLPVIASDWNSNSEIVKDGTNGLLCCANDTLSLENTILKLISFNDKITEMKTNCIEEANMYQPEIHIKRIIEEIEERC